MQIDVVNTRSSAVFILPSFRLKLETEAVYSASKKAMGLSRQTHFLYPLQLNL